MVTRVGGDLPDPINTETEYAGRVPISNTVGSRGPNERPLKPSEKSRLGYLTGQDEDTEAERQPYFMAGVDTNYPPVPEQATVDPRYRSDDYLE